MDPKGKTIVITGAARGIGAAIARRFAREGANIVLGDLDKPGVEETASAINGHGFFCDVTVEQDIVSLANEARKLHGKIDMFVSNAGICFGEGEHAASASNDQWQTCWEIHVMSHVYAARAVLPEMIERGDGYLLQMASAAGLLSQIGDAAYSATKHAALAFAESLSITHGKQGIRVSAICPQYVATQMTGYREGEQAEGKPSILSVDEVADVVLEGVKQEIFLILPHPEVRDFMQHKTADYERWLGGMRKLRENIIKVAGSTRLQDMHKVL